MFKTIGKLLAIMLSIMIALPPSAWAAGQPQIITLIPIDINATGYQAPVLKTVKGKVAKEINALNEFYNSMKSKPPRLVLTAAQGMIRSGGNLEVGKILLQQDDTRPPEIKLESLSLQQLLMFQGTYKEPGLLGLDGSREYLAEIFTREAEKLLTVKPPEDKEEAALMVDLAGMNAAQKKNDIDRYVGIMSSIAVKNDAMGMGFKAMIFKELMATMRKPESKRTKAEKAFVSGLEAYMKQQYIAVAEQAKQDWEDWLQKCEKRGHQEGSRLLNAYLGVCKEKPYDFNEAARARLTPGDYSMKIIAGSLVVTGMVTGTTLGTTSALGSLAAHVGSQTAVHSICEAIAPFAVKTAATTGSTALGSAVSAAAGPVAIIAAAAMIAAMQGDIVVSQVKAEQAVNEALENARKMRVDADTLLATRDGEKQFLYFFGKASGDESPSKPKKCGITLYEHADYQGKKYYVDASIMRFDAEDGSMDRPEDFNDKASSILFTRDDCPDLSVTVYDQRNYSTGGKGSQTLVSDTAYIGDTLNDRISSIRLYPDGKVGPENETDGCGICLFEDTNYGGAYFCVKDGWIKQLKDKNFNDKTSSVMIDTKKCPKAMARLFQKDESKGHVLPMNRSAPNLKKVKMAGALNWNDRVSSLEFFPSGEPTALLGECRVCVYEHENMAGQYFCAWPGKPAPNLIDQAAQIDMDDKASSVLIQQDGCPKGKVLTATLYEDKDYKGRSLNLPFPEGVPGLKKSRYAASKTWNDKASSLKANLRDANCSATLYEHAGYKGRSVTIFVNQSDLRQWDFNDQISSLKINKKMCPFHKVTLCDKDDFGTGGKGCATFTGDTSYIGDTLNDKTTSVKFGAN